MILKTYIAKAVMSTIIMVLLLLTALDAMFAFIAELESLSSSYQVLDALLFVFITLPRRMYEFLPTATLLGCLVALGGLANSSELVVMRAAGVSLRQIVWAALRPALLLAFMGVLVAEYVAPNTELIAQTKRSMIEFRGKQVVQSTFGYWHKDHDEYIYIQGVQPNGALLGVTRYTFDDQRLVHTSFSQRALYQKDYWFLEKTVGTRVIDSSAHNYEALTDRWYSQLSPDMLSLTVLKPDHLSLSGLYKYANYLTAQGLKADAYFLSFWKKLFQPLLTSGLVFLAVSFVFGSLRSGSMGQKVMVGVMVGLLFRFVQEFFGQASLAFQFSPMLAALLPVLLCLFVGSLGLRRVS